MSTSEALSDASMEALLAKAKASAESAMSKDAGTVAAPDAAVTDVVADAPAAPAFDPTSLLPLALMMGWKKLGIDTSEGTDALLYCQAAFVTAVALCAIIIVVIQRKAAANSTPGLLTVVEEEVEVKKTVSEHDLGEVKALQMQVLIPAALITVLHLKWGFVQPLPIQALVMYVLPISFVPHICD